LAAELSAPSRSPNSQAGEIEGGGLHQFVEIGKIVKDLLAVLKSPLTERPEPGSTLCFSRPPADCRKLLH